MCKKIKCIYRFLDKDNKVLYIGKTNDLNNRLNVHRVSPTGDIEKYKLTKFIEFVEFETDLELDLMERYFISSLNPRYNIINKGFKIDKVTKFENIIWKRYNGPINLYKKTKKDLELEELTRKDKIHNIDLNLFEVLFDLTLKSIIIDFEECNNLGNCYELYFNTLEEMDNKSKINEKLTKYFQGLYPNLNIEYSFIDGFLDNEYPLSIYRDENINEVIFNAEIHIKDYNKIIYSKIKTNKKV